VRCPAVLSAVSVLRALRVEYVVAVVA